MSVTLHGPITAFSMVPQSMGEAFELAKMMSDCGLLPDAFKGKPGNALMVIEQAMRWRMSPFAVAQEVSVIQGKMMHSGKIVAAAIQSAPGVLLGRLEYDYSGEGEDRTVIVKATLQGEAKPREVSVRVRDVKTNNAMWTKQPDQQLAYSGARVWARRYAPEVMLGVYTPEEFDVPSERSDPYAGTTIDARAETAPPASSVIPDLDGADVLRDRVDRLVQVLATCSSDIKFVAYSTKARSLLADIDSADRTDLKGIALDALAAARARFEPSAEDAEGNV